MSTMYDTVVLGSGPGGYEAAVTIAELGGNVAICEQDKIGGVCTNYGCIPTKALVSSIETLEKITNSSSFGISVNDVKIDFPAMQKRKDRIASIMSKGVEKVLIDAGVEIIKAHGKIISPTEIVVENTSSPRFLKTKNIVIATGSIPFVLPHIHLDSNILTSDDLLTVQEIPDSLLIVGGGFIGMEWGCIFAHLGTKVTVVEMLPHILPLEDQEIVSILQASLVKKNITFLTESRVLSTTSEHDHVITEIETKTGKQQIKTTKVLIAIGRKPRLDTSWQTIALQYSEKGIAVDEHMKTNIPGIYAIGDVTGKIMLAHVASRQAVVAAHTILGKPKTIEYSAIPNVVFTLPQVASVGLSEQQAKEQTIPYRVGRSFFIENGKARAMGEREGMVKVLINEKQQIIGVSMIGAEVTDLIAEATLAVAQKLTLEQVVSTVHAHPTLGELFHQSCAQVHA